MNSLNRFADPFYCMTRLIVGLMFASHGGQLVLGMFGGMPGSANMMMRSAGWFNWSAALLLALVYSRGLPQSSGTALWQWLILLFMLPTVQIRMRRFFRI